MLTAHESAFTLPIVFRIFSFFLVAFGLASCGGREPPSKIDTLQLNSTVNLAPSVHKLTADESKSATFIDASTIELPKTTPVVVGQYIILNDIAWQLASEVQSIDTNRVRFSVARAQNWEDIFSEVVLDGSFSSSKENSNIQPAIGSAAIRPQNAQLSSARALKITKTCILAKVGEELGLKCTFEWTPPTPDGVSTLQKATKLSLDASVGLNGVFNSWNKSKDSGTGKIKIPYEFNGFLEIGKEFKLTELDPEDACYVGRSPEIKSGRVHLKELDLAYKIALPNGIVLNVGLPLCLRYSLKSGISGRLINIKDSGEFVIDFVGNQKPKVTRNSSTPAEVAPPAANDSLDFGIDNNNLDLLLLPFSASVDTSLGIETGVEISLYGVFGPGANIAIVGKNSAKAEFSVAAFQRLSTNEGVPFSQWGNDALSRLCLSMTASVNLEATAYLTGVPFVGVIGRQVADIELAKKDIPLLKQCDLKVSSIVEFSASPNPATLSGSILLIASPKWNPANADDPRVKSLWKNSAITGEVTFFDNGLAISGCKDIPVSGGKATCSVKLSESVPTQKHFSARYAGNDTSFKSSTSPEIFVNLEEGPFAFETTEAPIPPANRLNCTLISNANDPFAIQKFSYERCSSLLDAAIRCVGDGCRFGRFKVALSKLDLIYAFTTFSESSPGQPCPVFTPNAGSVTELTGVYAPGSPFWTTLDNSWNRATPTSSKINPFSDSFNVLFRNITGIDRTNAIGSCMAISGAMDLEYNIFDTVKGTYTKIPFRISLP